MKTPLILPTILFTIALSACDSRPPAETATPTPAAETTAERAEREVKEAARTSIDAAKEAAQEAADAAKTAGDKAAEAAKEAADKAGEIARDAGDAVRETAHDVKETLEGEKAPTPVPVP